MSCLMGLINITSANDYDKIITFASSERSCHRSFTHHCHPLTLCSDKGLMLKMSAFLSLLSRKISPLTTYWILLDPKMN